MIKNNNAYTIIEISIVVIILSVILSLITNIKITQQNEQLKKIIAEIEQYNSEIRNFKIKYGFLPGDLKKTQIFNLSVNNTDGNENSLIEDKNQQDGIYDRNLKMDGEIPNFWLHLYKSGFSASSKKIFPYSDFLKTSFLVFSYDRRNYYHLAVSGINFDKSIKTKDNLDPNQAYLIDKKFDDGLPFSGNVFAFGGNTINMSNIKAPTKNCATEYEYLTVYRKKLCQLVMEIDI